GSVWPRNRGVSPRGHTPTCWYAGPAQPQTAGLRLPDAPAPHDLPGVCRLPSQAFQTARNTLEPGRSTSFERTRRITSYPNPFGRAVVSGSQPPGGIGLTGADGRDPSCCPRESPPHPRLVPSLTP